MLVASHCRHAENAGTHSPSPTVPRSLSNWLPCCLLFASLQAMSLDVVLCIPSASLQAPKAFMMGWQGLDGMVRVNSCEQAEPAVLAVPLHGWRGEKQTLNGQTSRQHW